MADKTEFLQAIDDAILDADSLEKFINGSDSETVLTRLSAEYPTLKKAIKQMFENGGLPATPFETKALMEASGLTNGAYALVTDDGESSGLYVKEGGQWTKSKYDPYSHADTVAEQKSNEVLLKVTSDIKEIVEDVDTELSQAFVDKEGTVLSGLYSNAHVETPHPPLRGFGIDAVRGQVLSDDDLSAAGVYLDKDASRDVPPMNFDVLVGPDGLEGFGHCRIGSMHQISPSRFYVVFTNYKVAGTDQAGGRLLARFVDVNFEEESYTLGDVIVLHDAFDTDEHPPAEPHFFTFENDVILIYHQNYNIVTLRSSDDCKTWEEVGRHIPENNRYFNIALNGIVRIPDGRYRDRIVATGFDYGYDGDDSWSLRSMYSDDNGVTWTQGWDVRGTALGWSTRMNETGITVLTDNSLLMTFRNENRADMNENNLYELKWGRSIDGGKSFEEVYPDEPFYVPACQVGMMQAAPNVWDGLPKIITTAPFYTSRRGLMLRLSYTNGRTWAIEKELIPRSMVTGYTSIVKVSRDTYGIVHEYGGFNAKSSVAIRFINNSEIFND